MGMKLGETISRMIISASGWRGIFAEDKNEESAAKGISEAHSIIAATAARVFSAYLGDKAPGKNAVLVGRDTRPTGEAIADSVIRSLLAEGREVRYTGISAAPEIMAYARSGDGGVAGFIYISASHNPIGHNGIKFGLTDGGVLQADESAKLISAFRSLTDSPESIEQMKESIGSTKDEDLSAIRSASEIWKRASLAAYRNFTAEVISGYVKKAGQEEFFAALRKGLEAHPIGIAADFNGSARTVSIDRDFLQSLGAGFYSINNKPGEITHRIVPEGESLDACRAFLEELHMKDPSVILGYMPDCDGDRGNLVIWDEGIKKARSLEAQEVFALACMAELSSLVWSGELKYDSQGRALTKVALAVNDPTSLRIDRIAGAFGAEVFRAEVGEANVVGLARKLRKEGYLVRILGEGSAGGTITHPSAVRDPLDTLGAILKLLAIRSGREEDGMGLFQIWCSFPEQAGIYRDDFSLADIITSLPAFISTGAYTDDALLKVNTADHGLLKDRYQKIFLREWEEKRGILKEQYGITGWKAIAYNGLTEKRGVTGFGEAGRGGLKIEFFRQASQADPSQADSGPDEAFACIWMRGSGTEPVFRVMADVEGSDPEPERFLIEWQRRMVLEADNVTN